MADACPDQTAPVGETVTLDGSGSRDADGYPLTYTWTPQAPAGSNAVLSDPSAVQPRFTVDRPGSYTARLIVNDGQADSAPDEVFVSTENSPPVADAGPDQSARVGEIVTLDGSGSRDVDGDTLGYAWSFTNRPEGSNAVLSDPGAVQPNFTLDQPGPYIVQLIVDDGTAESSATVTVSTVNSAPVAEAGPDQSARVGATVTLDGSGSTDADNDPLTYAWSLTTQLSGSTAALANADTLQPTLTLDRVGTYVAQLIVNHGTVDSDPDTVTLSTENSPPVAEAGPDQTAQVGDAVTLDGSGSTDADDDLLTYSWALTVQPPDSTVTLSPVDQAQTTLIPDRAGEYVAQLIVNDGTVDSDPNTALIEVSTTNQPPRITSTPITQATVGQPYSYPVTATDPDAGDELTFALPTAPPGMTIDTARGVIAWTPAQVGEVNVTVRVTDCAGLFNEQSFAITVSEAPPVNQALEVKAGEDQSSTLPASANLTGTVTDDGLPNPPGAVTITWSKDSGPGTVTFGNANAVSTTATFGADGVYVLRLTATDGALPASDTVQVTVNPEPQGPMPPDPVTVAPPVDPTVATTIGKATEFLYSGSNPIQTGVAPGTINPVRAAVLRGRVLDKQNNPLSGVTLTVLNHLEFGQTLSRADGWFDLVVNGGGYLTLNYQRAGYLPAQRQVNVPWQDFVVMDDVVLITKDAEVTTIDLTATTMQVAQSSVVTDQDGSRQPALLIPAGTTAAKIMPDGSTQPVDNLSLRFTEYTVGGQGPRTMPAPLPPTSGYTYAIELSADEATVKKNGKDVLFNQPIPFYVDNFLNFPVGGEVPVGYYDNDKGAWIPSENGRIMKVLSVTGGRANLDVTGSGQPADSAALAALGITDAERERLAGLYTVGKSVWRVKLTHLSTWDCNWPFGPPANAKGPEVKALQTPEDSKQDAGTENNPRNVSIACGSTIECENQILGESIPVVGTGLSLNYRSQVGYALRTFSGAWTMTTIVGNKHRVPFSGRGLATKNNPIPHKKIWRITGDAICRAGRSFSPW